MKTVEELRYAEQEVVLQAIQSARAYREEAKKHQANVDELQSEIDRIMKTVDEISNELNISAHLRYVAEQNAQACDKVAANA